MQKIVRKTVDIVLEVSDEEKLFRNKFYLDDSGSDESLQCTICSKETYGKIYPHPALWVIVCLDCLSKYKKHEFRSYLNADDTMCRWCTKSSMDINCSTCTCLFCNECLDRNFGPDYFQENWQCFICDPRQLWSLRAICTRAMENRPRHAQSLGAHSALRLLSEVKKDVDFFIHRFKIQFDSFYNRYSQLEYNKTVENVHRNREKLSKFFDSATENLEYLKGKTNMSFCEWQFNVPKINDMFTKEIEAAQQLEYKVLPKKKELSCDLSKCETDNIMLNANIVAYSAKRKNGEKRNGHPWKKHKTNNQSEPNEDDTIRIEQSQYQSTNHSQSDKNDHIYAKSGENTNLDMKQLDNIENEETLVGSTERNLSESSENNVTGSENKLGSSDLTLLTDLNDSQLSTHNTRANLILDLISSNQFTDLKNIDTLTNTQDVQSSDEKLHNSPENEKDLYNQTEMNSNFQSAEITSNDITKSHKKRKDSLTDTQDHQSSKSTIETDAYSLTNMQSLNHSGSFEHSKIKDEPNEYECATNVSTDTVILNDFDDLDSTIIIQQNLCDRTGAFYQSYSVGNDHIDLMIDENEQVSENHTEGEEYDAILEKVLEQKGFETNTAKLLMEEIVEKTNKTTDPNINNNEEQLDAETKNIESDSEVQVNIEESSTNVDNLQNTEEFQIALQKDAIPECQSQVFVPETKNIVGTEEDPQNVESLSVDPNLDVQKTVEIFLKQEPDLEVKQEEISQSFIATQLLNEIVEANNLDQPVLKEELEDEIKLEDISHESIAIKSELDSQHSSDTDSEISVQPNGINIDFDSDATLTESEFECDVTYNKEREEVYRRVDSYYDTSDEFNDLSVSGSSASSSKSSVSEIEIVLDPRQRHSDAEDNFSTDQSSEDDPISTPVQSDPKLLQLCRIQLVKSKEDLEIERLLNLKTLDKTTYPHSVSSDDSLKFTRKKKRKNRIEDGDSDNDTVSLTSDISEDPDNMQDDINLITNSPLPEEILLNDTDFDDDFSPDLLESEPVKKSKIAKKICEETKVISDIEIDPKSEWKKDRLLTGALNNDDSDSTDCSAANNLLVKLPGNKHKKQTPETDDSDSSDCFVVNNTKKRRTNSNDSETEMDSDDSDIQYLGTDDSISMKPKNKGRHNIREVLPDSLLEAETQKADKEEAERRKRIVQKNKSLDVVLSQSSFPKDEPKLVLDWDEVLKEPLVSVNPLLIPVLKPHQISGIKFMWDNCFESVARLNDSKGAGCILAHCMGLGKTMQVIVLAHTILTHPVTKVKHILVLCPLSTVSNWCNEFNKTLKDVADELKIYFITPDRYRTFSSKVYQVKQWRKTGGVLIISYDTFKSVIDTKRSNSETCKVALEEALLEPGPDLVVCDEGHILKSGTTNIFMSLKKVKTARRIILTGTPMQNNLKEYYYMVNFVKPSLLGTFKEYTRCFINPIENGQYEDSSKSDINLMRKRSHVLHKKLETTVQRYEVKELSPYLPKKNDHVLFLQLSSAQQKLYTKYLELRENMSYKKMLFQDFHHLQNIWTHPAMLQMKLDRKEKEEKLKVNHNSTTTTKQNLTDELIVFKEPELDGNMTLPFHWFKDHIPDDVMTNLAYGTKMTLLFSIIRECETIGEKLLVFSSSLIELDLIEHFLNQTRMMDGQFWRKMQNYFRMDGTVMSDDRSQYCESFNDKQNKKIKLFLVSHKVGGLGLNLIAASRVVLMDVSWNPAYDSQSVFRVYRFGQERECYIYRLVAMGTMEEVVYSRAVTKLAVSCRVVDEQQISRHFKSDELQRMYKLNLDFMKERPTPVLPPDRLLAKLWVTHNPILHNFSDHESLLQNQTHEELNEEEMKNAWDEYRQEEINARERVKSAHDVFPSTSGIINNSLNGIPITPYNYPFMNNPTQNIPIANTNPTHISSQFQQNNTPQNSFSYPTNSNLNNQLKIYNDPASILSRSGNNPQLQYNNYNSMFTKTINYNNPSESTTNPQFQHNKPTNITNNSYTNQPKIYNNPAINIPTSRSTNPQSQPNQITSNASPYAHTNQTKQYNNTVSKIASAISRHPQSQINNTIPNILSSHAGYSLQNQFKNPVSNNSASTSAKRNIPSNNAGPNYNNPIIQFKKPNPFASVAIGTSNTELQNVPISNNIRPNPLYQHNQNIPMSKPAVVSNSYKKPAQVANSSKLSEITTSANVMDLNSFPNKINEMLSLTKQTSLKNNGISLSVVNDKSKETTNGNDVPNVMRISD